MSRPDRETLLGYLARGLNASEITEAVRRDHGLDFSEGHIRRRLSEENLSTKSYDPESVIPQEWRPLRRKHRGNRDLMRLRQIDMLRRGEPLSADPETARQEERRLAAWIAELKEQNAVMRYYRNTKKGFYPFPRMEGDGEFTSKRQDLPTEAQQSA